MRTCLIFRGHHYWSKRTKETHKLIREAIEFHLEGMREDGLSIPEPTASAEVVHVL